MAKDKKGIIPIRMVSRLLPVKLTEEELRASGDELAVTVQEIDAEEDRQKSIKAQLKTRMSELTAKMSKLALRISRKEEFRDVQVAIEMQASGQVTETRPDTGEVLTIREAYEEEQQLSLGQEAAAAAAGVD